jgi:hypothetical protein
MKAYRLLFLVACVPACSKSPNSANDMQGGGGDMAVGPQYTVGGTVTGLLGQGLVLQNNGGDDLPVTADGAFTFATAIPDGAAYSVTVKTAPSRPIQTCTITNGSGSIAGADVTSVAIACSNDATDWLQFDFDAQHSGWNAQENTINATNVATLAQKMHVVLPSVADGAPAFLRGVVTATGTHDIVFVTSKNGTLTALDGTTLATLWSKQAATGPSSYTTSSPAIDPGKAYVYSYGLDGKVHKYAVADGTETTTGGWPEVATIKGTVEKGSSALGWAQASSGTYLYVCNGGYPGDAGDYQGHVTSINLQSGAQHVFNANCSNQPDTHFAIAPATPNCAHVQTAVWARAGVVYHAGLDRVFFATGNGDFDGNMAGGYDWADSLLEIRPDGTGTATGPLDSYTPTEFATLNSDDADLGSTAPALLPTPPGSKYPHLAVQSQKKPNASEAQVRLINLDDLSGMGGPGHLGGELQKINVPQGNEVLTAVAVWVDPADGSDWVFVANDNGISGIHIDVAADGTPSLDPKWTKPTGGASPVVANGLVFYLSTGGIRALDALTGNQLWNDAAAGGVHWESPIVVNGALYVTDEKGDIWRYGL